jgi:cytochrome b6-f complex iron-sulfur subunit
MPSRRALILGTAGALASAALAPACGDSAPPLPPGAVRVPLDSLPDHRRVTVMRADEPVELLRAGAVVTARSLFCPHFGCRLRWDDGSRRYLCPCHGGAFDEAGQPVAGPPTERMRTLPVEVQGDSIVVSPAGATNQSLIPNP